MKKKLEVEKLSKFFSGEIVTDSLLELMQKIVFR